MSNKVEHLNMIQSIISRMANNSLQVKCWCLAIVGAAIVLSRSFIILACVFPVVLFCFLDTHYLNEERAFRELYDVVRVKDDQDIDFSMKKKNEKIRETFKSWSIWPFYLSLIVLLIGVALYNQFW